MKKAYSLSIGINVEDKEQNEKLLRTVRNILIVGLGIGLIAILKALSGLLLPLVLALLLTFVSLPLVFWLKSKGLPRGIIIPVVALLTIMLVVFIVNIFASTISDVISQQSDLADQLDKKVGELFHFVGDRFNLSLNYDVSPLRLITDQIDFSSFLKKLAGSLGTFSSSLLLFILYYIFLLMGISDYKVYLHYVVGENTRLLNAFETVQKSISTYIGIKTIISLVTALNAFLICTFFGVEFALFWGFLTFILNYIPNIGSILSTLTIMLVAFIQFDVYSRFLAVSVLLFLNQMVIGNFLDPMIMGNRLRLNTVTVIFGLVFWGYIWDVPGMLLSVPLMVMIKLILQESESLGILARIMGNPQQEERKRNIQLRRRKKKDDRK